MSATIYDIAERLKLHYSTVAYALSGKGSIKPETRELVSRTAVEMGYVPNESAKRMREPKPSSPCFGMVVPTLSMLYNEICQNLQLECSKEGQELSLAVTEFNEEREDHAIFSFLKQRVACMLLRITDRDWETLPPSSPLRLAVKTGVPVILYQTPKFNKSLSLALTDWSEVFRLSLSHLKDKGHKRISLAFPYAGHYMGFADIMDEEGAKLGFDPKRDFSTAFPEGDATPRTHNSYRTHQESLLAGGGVEAGAELLRKARASESKPTAMIFIGDYNAVGAVIEAQRSGISIPGEMAVLSIYRNLIASASPLRLTTVCPDNRYIGRELFRFMGGHIDGSIKPGSTLLLKPELITGEST